MRVAVFGTSAFAVSILDALASSSRHTVVLCVTQPDTPRGRGQLVEPPPVKQAAQRLKIPVAQPARLEPAVLAAAQPEIGVVAAYGRLISRSVLDAPPRGMIGVHPSLLPKYRGAAPIAWAILNGEAETGVTIYQLTEELDAGAILEQERTAVAPDEDAVKLGERLARLGAAAALRALDAIERGQARPVPQDAQQATSAPKLTKAQGQIDWQAPADVIARLVRATQPWPGASTALGPLPLKVCAARVSAEAVPAGMAPGMIVETRSALRVGTGRGALEILELQPAGKRRMRAQEFLAGHRVEPGRQFSPSARKDAHA